MPSTRRAILASGLGLAAAGVVPMFLRREVFAQAAQGQAIAQQAGAKMKRDAQETAKRIVAAMKANPVCLTDYEPLAKERIPPAAYAYIAGGAGDEITLRANRTAFDEIELRQRVLIDVSRIDTRLELLGEKLAFPILLAPTATHGFLHEEAEVETARGAAKSGSILVVSSFSNRAIEEIARAATEPLWFQLYVQPDRGFTRELVQRAEAAGCRALCITVDTPVIGTRNREQRAGHTIPRGMKLPHLEGLHGEGVTHQPLMGSIYSATMDATLNWKDIEWLRSISKVPVVLKGITAPEDAVIAAKAGVDAIIVSNHGARNLDTMPATIEALPRITDATDGRIALLMDGGVRRGTDVLKALALGARAVLIGRPYLYGLAVGGAGGVKSIVEILRTEFEMAMALTGKTSLKQIDKSVLWDYAG